MSGLTETMGRMGWRVPDGYEPLNVSHCRRCTHEILWTERDGRLVPLERDGSRHPFKCRVDVRSKRRTNLPLPDIACPYCSKEYAQRDLGLHIRAKHRNELDRAVFSR